THTRPPVGRERSRADLRRSGRTPHSTITRDGCRYERPAETALPYRGHRAVVRTQRARSLLVAERSRAVLRRRLGHERRLPGTNRAATRPGPRATDTRRAAARDAAAESRRRLAAVVHVLRARTEHSARRLAWGHRVLAADCARAISLCFR